MATPPGLVHLAFAGGLDESQEPEVLDPMKAFAALQNGRQDARGGYTKRLGFELLGSDRMTGSRSAGNRLLSYGGRPCIVDGDVLDAYSEGLRRSAVASRLPEASVSTRPLVSVDNPTRVQAVHQNNSYLISASFAEPDASGVSLLRVGVETTEGVLVRAPETLEPPLWGGTNRSAEAVAEVCSHGATVYVFLREPLQAEIWLWTLDTTSAATVAAGWTDRGGWTTDAATQPGAIPGRQIATESLSSAVVLAFVNASGDVQLDRIVDGVLDATTNISPAAEPRAIAIGGRDSDTIWVAWDEPDIVVQGLSTDLASTLATKATMYSNPGAPLFLQVIPTTAGAGRVFLNAAPDDQMRSTSFHTSGGAAVDDVQSYIEGIWLRSHVLYSGGRQYGLATGPLSSGTQTVLVDLTPEGSLDPLRPVASVFPGLTKSPERPVKAWQVSSTKWAHVVLVQRSAVQYVAELVTFDFADAQRWQSVEHNGSLVMSGGVLSYFDGERVAEVGFLYPPNKPELTYDPPLVDGNSYRYVATYEEEDAAGNWCVSAISDPSDLVTLDETDPEVTVGVYPLAITARKRVRVSYYRTLNGGEPPYFYLDSRPNVSSSPSPYVEYVDDLTVSDALLATRRKLYAPSLATGGGEPLAREAPPHCQDVESFAGMLVIASGRDLRWSGQTVAGEGTWFSSVFQQPVDESDLTALAAQDGTLYAFTRRRVYAVAGEAPSDNGSIGGLGTPSRLAADVGCINPNSVVVTSAGVFFQSERGIELLSRGSGAVTWIGEGIQRTLAAYPIVSSAVLDERSGLVRFTLAEASEGGRVSGDGCTAVFDLTLGAWVSTDIVASGTAAQSAAMLTIGDVRRYGWLSADGSLYIEHLSSDEDAYRDDGAWIAMAAETGWFKLGGLQGQQHMNRALLLARKHGDHAVRLSLAYNYDETFKAAREWSPSAINALLTAGWPITQLKHEPHNDAHCQAVRLRIEDAAAPPPDGDPEGHVDAGRGATWIGLTLDITPKPGVFDVPEEAT